MATAQFRFDTPTDCSGEHHFIVRPHIKMGDTVYFETEGIGLKHYFYRRDNILVCWQVEPDKAETTYNDWLEFDFAILNHRGTP
jgi:hypothetical protein